MTRHLFLVAMALAMTTFIACSLQSDPTLGGSISSEDAGDGVMEAGTGGEQSNTGGSAITMDAGEDAHVITNSLAERELRIRRCHTIDCLECYEEIVGQDAVIEAPLLCSSANDDCKPNVECVSASDCDEQPGGFCAASALFEICAQGLPCVQHVEVLGCRYDECDSDSDCATGEHCECDRDSPRRICRAPECVVNSDCPAGERCIPSGTSCTSEPPVPTGYHCSTPDDTCDPDTCDCTYLYTPTPHFECLPPVCGE